VVARKLEKKMMTYRIRATTVIDYIAQRLAGEGASLTVSASLLTTRSVCDAVERSAKIKWIGCQMI
jgi:hypothetical protein